MKKNLSEEDIVFLEDASGIYNAFLKKHQIIQARFAKELGSSEDIPTFTSNLSTLADFKRVLNSDPERIGRLKIEFVRKVLSFINDTNKETIERMTKRSSKKESEKLSKVTPINIDPDTKIRVEKISATYNLYRLSSGGDSIKCFPMIIFPDSRVRLYDYFYDSKAERRKVNEYSGEAVFLNTACLAIRLTSKNVSSAGFHPRMLFHIPEYYQDRSFDYVEGISVRISKDNSPTASKDLLVFSKKNTSEIPPFCPNIKIGSDEYYELNNLPSCDDVASHLTGLAQNVLKASAEPNTKTEKEDLSSVYFLAGCSCVISRNDDADKYFKAAKKLMFANKELFNDLSTIPDVREHLRKIKFKPFKLK